MKVKDILKTTGIIKFSPEDRLSKVLKHLSSSHDCAFVFDKDKFLGVINPYYSLIKNSYPINTKLSSCLIVPPKLKLDDSLEKATRLMMESKIHYLPVLDGKNAFLGIISARRILKFILRNSEKIKHVKLSEMIVKKNPLVTVLETDTVSKALSLFKKNKVSKIVVLDALNRTKGILSYYDLINYIAEPRERMEKGIRAGNKKPFLHYKVKNFIKTRLLMLYTNESLEKAIDLILKEQIGSIIVVSDSKKPLNIITTKDILKFVFKHNANLNFNVVIKNLSTTHSKIVSSFVKQLRRIVHKDKNVKRTELLVRGEKNGGLFKIVFASWFKGGKKEHIKRETKDLKEGLLEVKKVVKELDKKEKR